MLLRRTLGRGRTLKLHHRFLFRKLPTKKLDVSAALRFSGSLAAWSGLLRLLFKHEKQLLSAVFERHHSFLERPHFSIDLRQFFLSFAFLEERISVFLADERLNFFSKQPQERISIDGLHAVLQLASPDCSFDLLLREAELLAS